MSIELKRDDYDGVASDMDGTLTDSEKKLRALLGEACRIISEKYNYHIPNLYEAGNCSAAIYSN